MEETVVEDKTSDEATGSDGAAARRRTSGAESEPAGGSGARRLRADAVKNRQRILAAAEAVFAADGVSAPIDVVAERAGVGVGTLYRHFPTKEALFEAIVMTKLEELVDATTLYADAADPGEAIFSFLQLLAREATMKHDLFDAIGAAGIDIKSRCAVTMDELERGVVRLLERASEAGVVRADVTAQDAIGLVVGACQAAERPDADDGACARMVGIVCEGLRAPAG